MNQQERDWLDWLKRAGDGVMTQRQAAKKMGVTERWVRKLLSRAKQEGDRVVVHGLRGRRIVLRSKTPELVEQEFYGFLMAHFAIRGLMHEAALKADEDPDRLSFLHAVRVVRRKLPRFVTIPPSAQKSSA